VAAEFALLVRVASRYRLEIGAGTKIAAGAGEHGDGGFLIGVEGEEGVVQFARGRAVDGVAAMRAVDGDDGDGAVAFDEHGIGIGHGGRSLGFCLSFRAMRSIELRCAIAHLRISRFRVWSFGPSRNNER
jgi:hypothetical protein